LLIFSLSVKME